MPRRETPEEARKRIWGETGQTERPQSADAGREEGDRGEERTSRAENTVEEEKRSGRRPEGPAHKS